MMYRKSLQALRDEVGTTAEDVRNSARAVGDFAVAGTLALVLVAVVAVVALAVSVMALEGRKA